MCTPLFLRPESKPAGREKPIRVAPIRVVTKYPNPRPENITSRDAESQEALNVHLANVHFDF